MSPVEPATARRLLALLGERQVSGRLPSIVAGVVRDGELVWSAGYGDVPGDPVDVQYRIGSITKTFTAVLVLQLVRDGRLDLAAPAADVLGDVGYADRSLRQLLSHSSGMQAEPRGSWWERSPGVSWDDLVAANDGTGAVFPPGQQHHYSNLGFAILGEVVARTLGVSWFDAVRERILQPLGLDRTTYLPTDPAAQGYSVDPFTSRLTEEPATDTRAMAPAGQLWSTVGDLARYNAFLAAGHPDVLDPASLETAAHPQSATRQDDLATAYGLGFLLARGGSGTLVGHTGSMPGFLAACLADRRTTTGAVVLSNATSGLSPGSLAAELVRQVLDCEPALPAPWQPPTGVPTVAADALGVWHWGTLMVVVRWDGDELQMREGDDVWCRFDVRGDTLVGTSGYLAGETLHVVRRPDGAPSHLECATFVFTRTPYDPDAPIPGGHP